MTRAFSIKNATTILLVSLLVVVAMLPIVWIFLTSLKTRADIFAYPPRLFFEPNFSAFQQFLTPGPASILPELMNSLIISIGATTLTLGASSLAAYAFSRYRFAGRWPLFTLMLASRLLPPITAVIPLFLLMNQLGLIDTHLGLVIIYTALQIPFATWMMKSFFDGIPKDLELAALIDGCSKLDALAPHHHPSRCAGDGGHLDFRLCAHLERIYVRVHLHERKCKNGPRATRRNSLGNSKSTGRTWPPYPSSSWCRPCCLVTTCRSTS